MVLRTIEEMITSKELGLILEDMHDENVLVNSETLFFIDTVFYAVAPLLSQANL